MRRNILFVIVASAVVSLLLMGGKKMLAQSSTPESMITRAVDESKRVVLRGNVHPFARAEYDQGAAPSTLRMEHMLLVLKRSPEQETALDTLIAQQTDKNSPNYHKWLTPAQFGAQFGPSEQDMTAITTWLGSHGFQVNSVANGRNMIDFSGTAGQVQEAFHTEMHRFVVNGQSHWANASDPQIPAALSPLVMGVNSLNDFRPRAMHHNAGAFQMNVATRKVAAVKPELTAPGGNCYGSSPATACYVIAPYDFATIYNTQPLWTGGNTGAGENIAIVSDSDVNTADYTQFRTLTGLPAETVNRMIPPTLQNPGIQNCSPVLFDEQEAILDVEWAGAVAPGATIDLVIAPSSPNCSNTSTSGESPLPAGGTTTYTTAFGGDYAAFYAVNTLNDPILSDSFGACELGLGTNGNAFYNTLWQQANTQGITVLTATGDNGSAGCDSSSGGQPAQIGLQVNGTASTPYDTAVGGTEFTYITASSATTYWNTTNTTSGTATTFSVKGPIPETAYNDSCVNSQIYSGFFGLSSATTACNTSTVIQDGLDTPVGGSGGFSNCTTPTGLAATDCMGGYAKPSWQTGSTLNIPGDGKRDIPDLSLFAGDGTVSGTFYLVCEEDAYIFASPASPPTGCSISNTGGSSYFFAGDGGTSVSAQAMAGIVALIDKKNGVRLGSVAFNTNLYALANAEGISNCNNSGSTPVANSNGTCIFKDVTTGTNSQPCLSGSTNCGTTITSEVSPIGGFRIRWTLQTVALGGCIFCASMLLFFVPGRQHRWSAALALVILGVVFGVVSCGGGSNGTVTGGGGGTTNTVGVLSGYNATAGYDRATGLGSVNVTNLVNGSGW